MSLIVHQPLFAAADFIQLLIYGIVFLFWVFGQLLGNKKNKKQPRPRPQQPQPVDMAEGMPELRRPGPGNRGPGNRGPGNPGPINQEDALRSEVEDFLRRAQGKPPKSKPTPQPVRQREPLRPKRKKPLIPVVAKEKRPTLRSEGVAEHVSRHISTQDIAAHAQTLGAEVATADDQLESRLHKKFDHEIGHLEHRERAVKGPEVDMAADVAAMLRSPEGMRQLIIANEILRRPEW